MFTGIVLTFSIATFGSGYSDGANGHDQRSASSAAVFFLETQNDLVDPADPSDAQIAPPKDADEGRVEEPLQPEADPQPGADAQPEAGSETEEGAIASPDGESLKEVEQEGSDSEAVEEGPGVAEEDPLESAAPEKQVDENSEDKSEEPEAAPAFEPVGWGPWETGAVQSVVGVLPTYFFHAYQAFLAGFAGIGLIFPFFTGYGALILVPIVLGIVVVVMTAMSVVVNLLGPLLSATLQAFIGDFVGKKRGAWLPTFLAIFLAQNGLTAVNHILLGVGVFGAAILMGIGAGVSFAAAFIASLIVSAWLGSEYSGFAGIVGAILGVPIVASGIGCAAVALLGFGPGMFVSIAGSQALGSYVFNDWGEDKKPGDEWLFRIPGFLSPSHPEVSQKSMRENEPQAMAY